MDPGLLNIKFDTLADARSELAAHYAATQATIDELKAKLAGSLQMWSGEARDAYDQVQRDWDAAIAHMAAVLQQAQAHLGNANDIYQTVERQNTTLWNL